VIRTLLMLGFWALALPPTALFCFPYTIITGDASLLYRVAIWFAAAGVKLTGVRAQAVGLEKLDPKQRYIFMANHVSNIDPPLLLPMIPGRTAVMVKKELFDYPILGRAMRLGSFIPVDRGNRDAGIAAVREAKKVIERGISMTIFPEGKRSFDGKLLPFKRGPFYLAMECGLPVVPITIVGTEIAMPKGRFSVQPEQVTVTFHEPIDPAEFTDRDALMQAVRRSINAGLPPQYQEAQAPAMASPIAPAATS
jgi:1-acyl-sn-glycerol-3-phosphate acyltransferase